MAKKITKNEAELRLKEIAKIDFKNSIPQEESTFLIYNNYVQDGENVTEGFCQKCGWTGFFKSPITTFYKKTTATCPDCGNTKAVCSRYLPIEQGVYVQEESYGFSALMYNSTRVIGEAPFDNRVDETWKKSTTIQHSTSVLAALFFDRGSGMFAYYFPNDKLYTNPEQNEPWLKFFSRFKSLFPEDQKHLMDEYNSFLINKRNESKVKKQASKATQYHEARENYIPKAVDKKKIANSVSTYIKYLFSNKGGRDIYRNMCVSCWGTWDEEYEKIYLNNQLEKSSCPHCGREFNQKTYRYNREVSQVIVYENTTLPENDLLIRTFSVENDFSDCKTFVNTKVRETQRIYAGKNLLVFSTGRYPYNEGTSFSKATVREINTSSQTRNLPTYLRRNTKNFTCQSNEEIANVIKSSCLNYSGLLESYGLGDSRYKMFDGVPSLVYLKEWYKMPQIELFLKANMLSILDDIIGGRQINLSPGKTLSEILNVSPHVIKVISKHDLSIFNAMEFNSLYKQDNTFDFDAYRKIKSLQIPPIYFTKLKKDYGIKYDTVMNYIQSVYDHQCIEKREAMSIWVDYLDMAKNLKFDLKDKSRKFPASLKKEHDVAMFAHRAVQLDIDNEQFLKQANENAKYEYSFKDLVCIVPKTPQDVIEEATRQKNCLRSYVERIKNGEALILFIRYKLTPENTLYTVEIKDGVITQLKGYQNAVPRNKEINEFIAHWAKAKSLTVAY